MKTEKQTSKVRDLGYDYFQDLGSLLLTWGLRFWKM